MTESDVRGGRRATELPGCDPGVRLSTVGHTAGDVSLPNKQARAGTALDVRCRECDGSGMAPFGDAGDSCQACGGLGRTDVRRNGSGVDGHATRKTEERVAATACPKLPGDVAAGLEPGLPFLRTSCRDCGGQTFSTALRWCPSCQSRRRV